MRRERVRVGLMAAALSGFMASAAVADVVTEQSASILVFPKVIADGSRDTVIQITNVSNSMVHAHCFYVNGALTFPDLPQSATNPPLWTEIDFDIWLTKQQPTYWVVSEGRLVDPSDEPCTRTDDSCPNSGFDPGRVPPVVEDFTGELKCIEVDQSGAPLSGNHLKGEATLVAFDICDFSTGTCTLSGTTCVSDAACDEGRFDYSKYNGIGVFGNENNNGDPNLCLGGQVSGENCPTGAEYNACPQTWILNHQADGAGDPNIGDGTNSSVTTTVSIVPCAQNYETQVPESVTVQFAITNEFEQTFSASTTVTCWADLVLSDINPIFTRDFVGSDFLQTRMRPSSGSNSGFMVVSEAAHLDFDDDDTTFTANNLHVEGERTTSDLIVIPAEQVGR